MLDPPLLSSVTSSPTKPLEKDCGALPDCGKSSLADKSLRVGQAPSTITTVSCSSSSSLMNAAEAEVAKVRNRRRSFDMPRRMSDCPNRLSPSPLSDNDIIFGRRRSEPLCLSNACPKAGTMLLKPLGDVTRSLPKKTKFGRHTSLSQSASTDGESVEMMLQPITEVVKQMRQDIQEDWGRVATKIEEMLNRFDDFFQQPRDFDGKATTVPNSGTPPESETPIRTSAVRSATWSVGLPTREELERRSPRGKSSAAYRKRQSRLAQASGESPNLTKTKNMKVFDVQHLDGIIFKGTSSSEMPKEKSSSRSDPSIPGSEGEDESLPRFGSIVDETPGTHSQNSAVRNPVKRPVQHKASSEQLAEGLARSTSDTMSPCSSANGGLPHVVHFDGAATRPSLENEITPDPSVQAAKSTSTASVSVRSRRPSINSVLSEAGGRRASLHAINSVQSDMLIHAECMRAASEGSKHSLTARAVSDKGMAAQRKVSLYAMDQLRMVREQTLVDMTIEIEDNEDEGGCESFMQEEDAALGRYAAMVPRFIFVLFGIVPPAGVGRKVYSWVQLLFLSALVIYTAIFSFDESQQLPYVRTADVIFAAGSMVGLLSLRFKEVFRLLGHEARPLELYANKHGFLHAWMITSAWNCCVSFAFFGLTLVTPVVFMALTDDHSCIYADFFLSPKDDCIGASPLPPFPAVIAIVAVYAAVIYCLLHICCGLELMVDGFCLRFFEHTDFERGISEWNTMQAIVRRTAHSIDACFLSLQTTVIVSLILFVAEIFAAGNASDAVSVKKASLRFVSMLSPTFLMLYCLYRGAAVTEKCLRSPALVNSLLFDADDSINEERQYMVQYMQHSAAGFYVNGVRLTVFMVLKCTYVLLLATFTCVTQVQRLSTS